MSRDPSHHERLREFKKEVLIECALDRITGESTVNLPPDTPEIMRLLPFPIGPIERSSLASVGELREIKSADIIIDLILGRVQVK